MFSFFVKNLKFIEELSSRHKKITNVISKLLRVSISSVWDVCLMELDELFASFFLNSKERENVFSESIKGIRTERPDNHRIVSLRGRFPVNNRATETLNEPREDWKFCVTNFKANHPIFASPFSFRPPVFDSEASFSVNQSGHICEIGSRRLNVLFEFFERFEVFFINSIIHVNFLFKFFDDGFSFLMRGFWDFLVSTRKTTGDFFDKRATKSGRFLFQDEKRFNLRKDLTTCFSFCIPKPSWTPISSFFGSQMNCARKFVMKIFADILIYGTNLKRRFVDLYKFWFLNIEAAANAPVAICISSQISGFHDYEFYRQSELMSIPATTNRLGLSRKEYVIV